MRTRDIVKRDRILISRTYDMETMMIFASAAHEFRLIERMIG